MTTFAQYIAVIMLHEAEQLEDEAYSGTFVSLSSRLSTLLNNVKILPEEVEEALDILQDFAGAKFYPNPLTKGYWQVNYDNFRYYFIQEGPDWTDNDKEEYTRLRDAVKSAYPILVTYADNGAQFAKDTIAHLQSTDESEWVELRDDGPAKKSNAFTEKIVLLDDKQVQELATATDQVIFEFGKKNAVDDDPNLRNLIIGQLKAGRELVLSGCMRLHLLQTTLIDTLVWLSKRYENEAVAAAATILLTALAKHLGIEV